MNHIIATINKEEASQIEYLQERLNSLKELSLSFENENVFMDDHAMYERIIHDLAETKKKCVAWWSHMVAEYALDDYLVNNMYVDFTTFEIYIR